MSEVSLLFYSNKCQNCKKIVSEINQTPVRSAIRYVCIDDKNIRAKLPQYIKSVPTLVVGGSNQIHVGNQILGFIKMMSMKTVKQQEKKPEIRVRHAVSEHKNEGPLSFSMSEMGNSYSDNYSFVDIDGSSQGNGGTSISHSFDFIGKRNYSAHQNSELTQNVSSYGSIEQKNENENELSKKMEKLMASRSIDVPAAPQRM